MHKFLKSIIPIVLLAMMSTSSLASAETNNINISNEKKTIASSDIHNVILPNNNRRQIFNTTSTPYQSIAFVNINNRYIASAVVIDKNTLLTNKHVVKGSHGIPSRLTFAPGASGSHNFPYGTFKGVDYSVSPYGDDLAVVHVGKNTKNQSIGDVVTPATMGDIASISRGSDITVTGYPGDKPLATMWESFGKVINRSGNNLSYDLSTINGNSGSPVFSNGKVIGLHYGGVSYSHNSAVLFTNQVKQFILDNSY